MCSTWLHSNMQLLLYLLHLLLTFPAVRGRFPAAFVFAVQPDCSKLSRLMQEIVQTEAKLSTAREDLQQSQQAGERQQEHIEEVGARSRDLYDTTVRLEAHIADLEGRKRAPLYQKKQEEELRAVIKKAQEREIRAVDAEIKYNEAKVRNILLIPGAKPDAVIVTHSCTIKR